MFTVETRTDGIPYSQRISLEDLISISKDMLESVPIYLENLDVLESRFLSTKDKLEEINEYQSVTLVRKPVDIEFIRSTTEYAEMENFLQKVKILKEGFNQYKQYFQKNLQDYQIIERAFQEKP